MCARLDALAALREMLRVVKPEGALAFAVWYHNEFNQFMSFLSDQEILNRMNPPRYIFSSQNEATLTAEQKKLLSYYSKTTWKVLAN